MDQLLSWEVYAVKMMIIMNVNLRHAQMVTQTLLVMVRTKTFYAIPKPFTRKYTLMKYSTS